MQKRDACAAALPLLKVALLAALIGGASAAAQDVTAPVEVPASMAPPAGGTPLPPAAEASPERAQEPEQAVAAEGKPVEALTPYGAQAGGNAEGSIPAWTGGLTAPPPCWQGPGGRYCDPYAEDRPLYTVTAENLAQYEKYLSPGQRALFAAYPDTWRMRVFATRRSFANPPRLYAAAGQNATRAVLDHDVLSKAAVGVPFPRPANGAEVICNHRLRYRPPYSERRSMQFAVEASGDLTQVALHEWLRFPYGQDGYSIEDADGVLAQRIQLIEAPPRLAGSAILIDDMAAPKQMARHAWQRSAGEPVMRRVPNLGYDTPGLASSDLRTNDQLDTYFGPTDFYDFKLRGKQELLVPANSYALHSDAVSYRQIIGPHHLNPDLLRYELRRVWVVEATVRRGLSHRYRSRRFYVDEDGWQIRVVDNDDDRGELWRVQEAHTVMAYDQLFELPVAETVYDLRDRRYLVQALNNQAAEIAYPALEPGDFRPTAVARRASSIHR